MNTFTRTFLTIAGAILALGTASRAEAAVLKTAPLYVSATAGEGIACSIANVNGMGAGRQVTVSIWDARGIYRGGTTLPNVPDDGVGGYALATTNGDIPGGYYTCRFDIGAGRKGEYRGNAMLWSVRNDVISETVEAR